MLRACGAPRRIELSIPVVKQCLSYSVEADAGWHMIGYGSGTL